MAKRARRHEDNGHDRGRSGPRAMWKGAVTFGLVTVPVALHAATERLSALEASLRERHPGARAAGRRQHRRAA